MLIALRTSFNGRSDDDEQPISYILFFIVGTKLNFVATMFALELLGPDGTDGMTWRTWLSWLPGVQEEGTIKLVDAPEDGNVEWEQKECPRLRANIFSRLTFSWLTPM